MTSTEATVAELCRRKLRVERVDPSDDIRALGADSLFIVELAVELEDAFDLYVPPEALEADTHVFRIAEWLDGALRENASAALRLGNAEANPPIE